MLIFYLLLKNNNNTINKLINVITRFIYIIIIVTVFITEKPNLKAIIKQNKDKNY